MTDAERLRKAIAKCDWLEPAYTNRDICAAIVEEFGLTKAENVWLHKVLNSGLLWEIDYLGGPEHPRRIAKLIHAILDVAEGK